MTSKSPSLKNVGKMNQINLKCLKNGKFYLMVEIYH